MMRRALLVAAACALALAGCGGHHHRTPVRTHPVTLATACPRGDSFMGCSAKAAPSSFGVKAPAPKLTARGAMFPDVSDWQGHPAWVSVAAWQRAHGWTTAAIFKLGEFSSDPDASYNASETARLRFAFRAGYWFVRPTGCGGESAQIIAAARRYGLKVIALDVEVPGVVGYAACLAPPLKRAGLIVVLYTSPGLASDVGSSAGLSVWEADYGSGFQCLFTCRVGDTSRQSILAWQCTDGHFGCVTNVPGIGRDDVSIDLGITRLGLVKPKPKPVVPAEYKVLTRSELVLVRIYDAARKAPKTHVSELRNTERALAKLAHAVWVTAQPYSPVWGAPSWGVRHRGVRFQTLYRRSLGQQVVR